MLKIQGHNFKFLASNIYMHDLADIIHFSTISIFGFLLLQFFNIPHFNSSSFVNEGFMLYEPGCKFIIEDSEIRALSIHVVLNKLICTIQLLLVQFEPSLNRFVLPGPGIVLIVTVLPNLLTKTLIHSVIVPLECWNVLR